MNTRSSRLQAGTTPASRARVVARREVDRLRRWRGRGQAREPERRGRRAPDDRRQRVEPRVVSGRLEARLRDDRQAKDYRPGDRRLRPRNRAADDPALAQELHLGRGLVSGRKAARVPLGQADAEEHRRRLRRRDAAGSLADEPRREQPAPDQQGQLQRPLVGDVPAGAPINRAPSQQPKPSLQSAPKPSLQSAPKPSLQSEPQPKPSAGSRPDYGELLQRPLPHRTRRRAPGRSRSSSRPRPPCARSARG